jgi:protein O-GlcNAc transferase
LTVEIWLVIPVITLRFPTITGRCSASILTTLGLTDWIAETEDAYVALAVSKAHDREALAVLRSTLRARVKSSVLGDAKAYVKSFEVAYRELWRTWVQQQITHDPGMALASDAPTNRGHP